MKRTVAEGNLARLFYGVLAFALVIAVGSWLPQFLQAYEIQTAGRIACNDLIYNNRFNATKPVDEPFMSAAVRAGIHLKREQFTMTAEHQRNRGLWICTVRLRYPISVDYFLLGDVLQLKPIKFDKRFSFTHEVPDSY